MTTIIIGLGNPGEQYKNTRHNVGFMVLDKYAKENDFPEFELQKKPNALVSKKENVLIAKPQTFMNDSGKTAKELLKNNKSEETTLIIIHDDIDLPVGKMKIVKERGSAGHKGVESIINNIGNEGLIRFRIGIADLEDDVKAEKVVLKNFSSEEQILIDQVVQKTAEALDCFLRDGLEKTMSKYN